MKRSILAVFVGAAAWIVVVSMLNRLLRLGIPGYTEAEPLLAFTLGMMLARLLIGGLSSVAAGAVAGWIARPGQWAPWITGAVFLALFIPEHIQLWQRFPLWYHLTFLLSLVPLFGLGGALGRRLPRR
jgi:hypothetical protein